MKVDEQPCPNCGEPFRGRYCHHCGFAYENDRNFVAAILIGTFLVLPAALFSGCFLLVAASSVGHDEVYAVTFGLIGIVGLLGVAVLSRWMRSFL